MIQEAFTYVEQTPDLETKLKLIDTLRTVTDGKVTCAPKLWNCLPDFIRRSPSVSTFKSSLKTYLFKRYFIS